MKTGKEIKEEILARMAQTGIRSRETAATLFMQMTSDVNGLMAFDGDARKRTDEYWNSKVETCFFTDEVDGGCKLTWLMIGERTVTHTGNGKKCYGKKTGRGRAKWYQVISIEPYDMSKAQWDEHNQHIRNIMSAVSHGKKDPNAVIIDSLGDDQRWDMERIYTQMKDFLFMHDSTDVIEKSDKLMAQWIHWEKELASIDTRLHFNMIDYVYGEK